VSLSTDALLFSIVLMLFGIQTALPVTAGGGTFLLAGLGVAVAGLLGSMVSWAMSAQRDRPAEDS
jgi:hypothetical protein